MTDNEIIKALECCPAHIKCEECPMKQKHNCMSKLNKDALDLINRQKAEIERLKLECYKLYPKGGAYSMQVEASDRLEHQIKSEAIKEFAERLENNLFGCDVTGDRDNVGYISSDVHRIIDNLVKEMTEVSE